MRCKPLSPAVLAQAYRNACLAELQAIKPGNVHVFADGHGMTVHDFIKSADATAELISQAGLTVGERILLAVKATQSAVGMNTNLGLILLCAPLIHAALSPASELDLAQNLARVLDELSVADGALAAQAIVLAKPAGLGTASQHDVQAEVGVNLKQLMLAAADRDRIAWQYANNYDTIFCLALPRF
jgi:triphosphoribosyl-dephospho-CoA synthase